MKETPRTEDQVLEALAGIPSFSTLDDRGRRKLAKLCTLKTYQAGDVLFEEGAIGLSVFVVVSGRAESYRTSDGRKVGLGTVEAGGVLGGIALLDDSPRSASAAALETTECLLLTRDSFETLIKKDPQIAWCLVPSLAGRVRELEGRAMELELGRGDRDRGKGAARATQEKAERKTVEAQPSDAGEDEDEDEDEEVSELESAFYKMMRMQYGLLAGGARGLTEMAKMMESFFDALAAETDLKTSEDWRGILESTPDAMVTATRKAMDESDSAAQEVVDAYRRYSEGKE